MSVLHVLITSIGSVGDIFPLIQLGAELRKRGHRVRYAASEVFRSQIERGALEFVPTAPHWTELEYREFMTELNAIRSASGHVRFIYEGISDVLDDYVNELEREIQRGVDLVLGSHLLPFVRAVAERNRVPFVGYSPFLVPTVETAPSFFPGFGILPVFCRKPAFKLMMKGVNFGLELMTRRIMREAFARNGIDLKKKFFQQPAELTLVGLPKPFADGGFASEGIQVIGAQRWQFPDSAEVRARLDHFCDGEKVPVVTLGSMAFEEVGEVVRRFLCSWPVGKKVIVQNGWAGLGRGIERDEILVLDEVSHDQLFAYASLVAHHGGAGTTTSVMCHGIPHVIIPHIADQFVCAREIERRGLGRSILRADWPERLSLVVGELLSEEEAFMNARRLQSEISASDSGEEGAILIEEFLSDRSAL